MPSFKLAMAQFNPFVGAIEKNTERVIELAQEAWAAGAKVIIFPELTLCGYPPEDLLFRQSMDLRIQMARDSLVAAELPIMLVVGYPGRLEGKCFNIAGALYEGQWIAEYAKQELPNYKVFDEKRYFSEGNNPCVFDCFGVPTALTICEDIWHPMPMEQAKAAGAQLMFNLNASPFHEHKPQLRHGLLRSRARSGGMPIVYVNQVGGQDELVFDGGSMVVDEQGEVVFQAPWYQESLYFYDIEPDMQKSQIEPIASYHESLYQALVLGVRDYVRKNGFGGVILGLSGGIDSALTLTVAVDALGADKVHAVMMPFHFTSQLSQDDAHRQAETLGVHYRSISIESMYDAFMASLADEFQGYSRDTTEENLQARCRGVILMAISNKKGYLVLTTGNKSELAVGYSTLYGDMAGGFNVLKDVYKTTVFELARYRNSLQDMDVIPQTVIDRPPSAELSPDQKDEDSLPPYEILDQILKLYIEEDLSAEAIVSRGFDRDTVYRVLRLVDLNEYKRRQAPVGPRLTERGFGRDRRYPITNGWKPGV